MLYVAEMTFEPRQSVASRAHALRNQMNLSVRTSEVAREALRIVEDAGDHVLQRWLTLELTGYGEQVDTRALHDVLAVPQGHRLVAHVTAYRTQRGIDATSGHGPAEFRHFFIEPLSALEAARDKVAVSAGGGTVLLDFGPHPRDAHYPTAGEFTREVFDRIIAGFMAALHLQLGTLTA